MIYFGSGAYECITVKTTKNWWRPACLSAPNNNSHLTGKKRIELGGLGDSPTLRIMQP